MTFALLIILRSSLVLAIGLAALWAFRKQPAALRHSIMVAAIVLAAAQPLMNRVMPAWHVVRQPLPTPVANAGGMITTDFSFALNTEAFASARAPQPVNWPRLAYRTWLAGVLLSIAVLIAAAVWLLALGARAAEAGEAWQRAANDLRARLGIRYPIRIAITQHPAMLVTWGAVRPVILLPKDAEGWPADRIELVLAHEMGHLIRRDWLIQLMAEFLRAIYWFNPLFWIACSRLRRESEFACDDIVLNSGIGGTSYASHLVDLARSFSVHGRTWLPAPSIARPSTLERRVRAMVNPQVNRRPVSRSYRWALGLLLLAVALPIAVIAERAAPSGVLRDPSGRVLPGATVRLSAIGRDAIHETQSDATGAFQFPEIADGEYMMSARLLGFQTTRQRVVVSGNSAPLDMTLQVGTLRETVMVKAGSAVDTQKVTGVAASAVKTPIAPSCGNTELGGNLKPPMKLKDVRPRYKQQWFENNVEGEVVLQAIIGVDGRVRGAEVVSSANADLEEEAIAAVSQWQFSPTYLNCAPIEVRMFVTVSFKIDR
jgi:TonB family protein